MNRIFRKKPILFSLLSILMGIAMIRAQNLEKPELGFYSVCRSETHKVFKVTFQWNPNPSVSANNKFVLELSDANGNFTSPTTLATVTDKNETSKFAFEFKMPQNVRGNKYKVRVRSTSPAKTSPESNAFEAYYTGVTDPLVINNYKDASICKGASVILKVDNHPNENSYKWYKNGNIIPGEHKSSIKTSEPGDYFVRLDYGSYCSSATTSNYVKVDVKNSLGLKLEGAEKVSLCQDQTYTLATNQEEPTWVYTWYKNDQKVKTGKSNKLEVKGSDPGFAGNYYVEVERSGGCKEKTPVVQIDGTGVDLSLDAPEGKLLLPGQTITLQATTNVKTVNYEWYKNGVVLTGKKTDKLVVETVGDYYVKVSQTKGCTSGKTSKSVKVTEPSDYTAHISAPNYSDCSKNSVTLSLKKIEATTPSGEVHAIPQSWWKDFSYQWVYNKNPLPKETLQSIEISDPTKNGAYALVVSIKKDKKITSEAFNVKLGTNTTAVISADKNVVCDNGKDIKITSKVTDGKYRYTWYKDGVELTEKTPAFTTSLPGTYQLQMETYGCITKSNELVIHPFDKSSVTIDAPETIAVPEGESKVITASGGDAYQWFNAKKELIGNGPSVTLSEEGAYTLLASVGECQANKTIKLTHLTSHVVPNIVTPNGDGFNDFWVIPNSYAYQKDITITIYEQSGTLVYETTEYQNNWPESSRITHAGDRPLIYYYKITRGKETLKQGTITMIK